MKSAKFPNAAQQKRKDYFETLKISYTFAIICGNQKRAGKTWVCIRVGNTDFCNNQRAHSPASVSETGKTGKNIIMETLVNEQNKS